MRLVITFIALMGSAFAFIASISELPDKVRKSLPVLTQVDQALETLSQAATAHLPAWPDCTFCYQALVVAPVPLAATLIVMLAQWLVLLPLMGVTQHSLVTPDVLSAQHNGHNGHPAWTLPVSVLAGTGALYLLSNVWALHKFSGRTLVDIITHPLALNAYTAATADKSLFYWSATVYYTSFAVLFAAATVIGVSAWVYYVRNVREDRIEQNYRTELAVFRFQSGIYGPVNPNVFFLLDKLFAFYLWKGLYSKAATVLALALELAGGLYPPNPVSKTSYLVWLGWIEQLRGREAEAERHLQAAVAMCENPSAPAPQKVDVLYRLATLYAWQGRLEEAAPLYQQGIAAATASKPPMPPGAIQWGQECLKWIASAPNRPSRYSRLMAALQRISRRWTY
jgi:tetratricopeptide (TPR) repeat protein